MRNLLKAPGIVAAIAFAASVPSVGAEELSFKLVCRMSEPAHLNRPGTVPGM
jgi:hypothetical protein